MSPRRNVGERTHRVVHVHHQLRPLDRADVLGDDVLDARAIERADQLAEARIVGVLEDERAGRRAPVLAAVLRDDVELDDAAEHDVIGEMLTQRLRVANAVLHARDEHAFAGEHLREILRHLFGLRALHADEDDVAVFDLFRIDDDADVFLRDRAWLASARGIEHGETIRLEIAFRALASDEDDVFFRGREPTADPTADRASSDDADLHGGEYVGASSR